MLIEKLVGISQLAGSGVLYLLIALSVWSFGIVFERWWFFRKHRSDQQKLGADLAERLRVDDILGARKRLAEDASVEAEILAEALAWHDRGPEAFEQILAKAIRERRKKFEQGLLFLGTLGSNAPFIGLFGTVLGIIAAFKELAATTTGGGGSGGMNNVMAGIGEALVATAVGILVAIPAVVAYNVFQKRGADVEENAQSLANVVLAAMKATRAGGPAALSGASASTGASTPTAGVSAAAVAVEAGLEGSASAEHGRKKRKHDKGGLEEVEA